MKHWEVLLTCPGVKEAAVIGAPDKDWGEIVVACVVAEAGTEFSDSDLDRHCLATLGRFKRPKRYVRLPELPKNNNGKVLKNALRELTKPVNGPGR